VGTSPAGPYACFPIFPAAGIGDHVTAADAKCKAPDSNKTATCTAPKPDCCVGDRYGPAPSTGSSHHLGVERAFRLQFGSMFYSQVLEDSAAKVLRLAPAVPLQFPPLSGGPDQSVSRPYQCALPVGRINEPISVGLDQ